MLGMRVMLNQMFGEPTSDNTIKPYIGKMIIGLTMSHDLGDWGKEDSLFLRFGDGEKIRIWDGGQSCCELRYMTTDDDLDQFVGATLMEVEVRDGPTSEGKWGDPHEVQFLVITTSKGVFTIETHNEHNGYYGGFWLKVASLKDRDTGE